MSREVLRLYRNCLRTAYQFPLKHHGSRLRYGLIRTLGMCIVHKLLLKYRHNMREIFEVYRNETEAERIKKLVADGWKNLETLNKLSKWDAETWKFGMQV